MIDYLSTTLDLMPTPASLFEAETHRLVQANRATLERGRPPVLDPGQSLECDAVDRLEHFRYAQAATASGESPFVVATDDHGWVIVSRIPATTHHARPDLLLLTTHDNLSQEEARLHHCRLVISLDINETAERAIKAAQSTMLMLNEVAVSQQAMVDHVNSELRGMLRKDLEDSRPNHLTLVGGVPQG